MEACPSLAPMGRRVMRKKVWKVHVTVVFIVTCTHVPCSGEKKKVPYAKKLSPEYFSCAGYTDERY